jgi:hypothetical protein
MSESIDRVNLYRTGKTLREVGEAFGVSHEQIRLDLITHGEQGRFFKQKKKDAWERQMYGEAVAIIRERYIKGEHLRAVARDVGVPWYVVEKLYTKTEADEQAHIRATFFSRTKIGSTPDGFDTPCLEWTGTLSHGTNPIYCQTNTRRNAKQWHWWFKYGEWVTVERTCPNPLCVGHIKKVEENI